MTRQHTAESVTPCQAGPDRWVVIDRHGNRSAFNGYRWTHSAYSRVGCLDCGTHWRTKAAYVESLPDGRFTNDPPSYLEVIP